MEVVNNLHLVVASKYEHGTIRHHREVLDALAISVLELHELRVSTKIRERCQGREMMSSVYELLFSEVPNVLYILAPKYLT